MITRVWADRGSVGNHKTIASFEYQQNQEILKSETPVVPKDLKPGERFDQYNGEDKTVVSDTHNDRIVFANGGSIEDQPDQRGYDESGTLKLTSPNGETKELDSTNAWVAHDEEPECSRDEDIARPTVFFSVKNGSDDVDEWKQTFPLEGGTYITPLDSRTGNANFRVSPEGKVTAEWEGFGDRGPADGSLKNGALIAKSSYRTFAIVPPVPVEWLVS